MQILWSWRGGGKGKCEEKGGDGKDVEEREHDLGR